ncbi:PhzF family phenazine biosynthesis protein [Cysteiniphilum halobium]|uniref:PhzF family phenazine biosynthesis protein n=1 Tax=Cysteiniphilum halobium TaxID=2219059 RepID=UPI003F834054
MSSKPNMKFWTVDAFAHKPYAGNPAAVILVDDFPDGMACQKIAAEINLSETAFVKPLFKGRFHIRWFTPAVEVKLCGHATLAAAHVLDKNDLFHTNSIVFQSLSGELTVSKHEDKCYTLNFPLQETQQIDKSSFIANFPQVTLCEVAQAYDDIIVELESDQAVRSFKPDFSLLTHIDCRGVIITAKGSESYDFVSRFFGPRVGVNEDPVTGSAHCKLAHYWMQKLNKKHFQAYQASSRGGEINIEVDDDRVLLSGQAILMSEGYLQHAHNI